MKYSSSLLLALILIINQNLSAQEVVDNDALYSNADLIYKASNDSFYWNLREKTKKWTSRFCRIF